MRFDNFDELPALLLILIGPGCRRVCETFNFLSNECTAVHTVARETSLEPKWLEPLTQNGYGIKRICVTRIYVCVCVYVYIRIYIYMCTPTITFIKFSVCDSTIAMQNTNTLFVPTITLKHIYDIRSYICTCCYRLL